MAELLIYDLVSEFLARRNSQSRTGVRGLARFSPTKPFVFARNLNLSIINDTKTKICSCIKSLLLHREQLLLITQALKTLLLHLRPYHFISYALKTLLLHQELTLASRVIPPHNTRLQHTTLTS